MSEDGSVESGSVIVVTGRDGGVLVELLMSRNRPLALVTAVGELPESADGVRALAVLPDVGEEVLTAITDLVSACHAAHIPILGIGSAAGVAGSVIGVELDSGEGVVTVDLTEDAEEDPMMAPTPSGVEWMSAGVFRVTGDATVLAVAGERALVAVAGATYAIALDVTIDDDDIDSLIEQDRVTDASRPFLKAHSAALLGRWVDLVVGRTEAEMPWGRRGPQPVAAPGLSLNPA